jgi:hypothetical protein
VAGASAAEAAAASSHPKSKGSKQVKKPVKHIAAGGVVAPTALAGAVLIGNEIQTALGLNLQGIGLAIYIAAFILASGLVLHGQLRLEAQRIVAELGNGGLDLGALLGGVGDLFGGEGPKGDPGPITTDVRKQATEPPAAAPSAMIAPPPDRPSS